MKPILFFLFLLLFTKAKCEEKDTVQTGIYLKSLFDFNSSDFSYDADFWIWFLYKNDSLHPLETVEIANAKSYSFIDSSIEHRGKKIWAAQNSKAVINQNWDLKNYPFDHQKLQLIFEESEKDLRKVVLTTDPKNFAYNNAIDIKGWKIDSTSIKCGVSHYKSDFGDPTLNGESDYSKIYYSIYLSRDSYALFFKLFTGCYVAFLVSFLVYFIKPIYVDPRFGLSIGALFAAVGNKYVVDSNIPESISFTLVDKIHLITFVYILVSIGLSIISLHIYDRGQFALQKKFDYIVAIAFFLSYLLINGFMIITAQS